MFRNGFLNVSFAQNNLTVPVFDEFLSRINVDRIVEIGTGCGIFTVFLGMYCHYNNKKLITFDVKDQVNDKTQRLFDALKIDYRIKDIFENVSEIGGEISKEGTAVVLCDNGNKVKEFNIFSKFLKTGDFILAHDYSKSLEYFNAEIKGKYWNWMEIDDKRIQEVCEQESLKDFMSEEFQKCVWVCKRKG